MPSKIIRTIDIITFCAVPVAGGTAASVGYYPRWLDLLILADAILLGVALTFTKWNAEHYHDLYRQLIQSHRPRAQPKMTDETWEPPTHLN